MELPQLPGVDRRRCVGHLIDSGRGLGKRDDLTNRTLAGQNGHDAVQPERDAAVGWRAVLERIEEEAEAQLRLLVADVEQREDLPLQRRVMDSDTAAADLTPV